MTSLVTCLASCSARQLPPREVRSLSTDDLGAIAKLDPPEWNSVSEGHLSKLLVPRACKLAENSYQFKLTTAGSENK